MKALFNLVALTLLALAACDRPPVVIAPSTPIPEPLAKTKTLETSRLADEIDRYDREPTPANRAAVNAALAALDGEIAELQQREARTSGNDRAEASAKLRNLQTYRATQAARFTAMQPKEAVGLRPISPDERTGAEKAEDSARKTGDQVEDSARKAGQKLGDALDRAGEALKDATR